MGSCTWENSGTRDEKVGSITLGESTITSARPGFACGDAELGHAARTSLERPALSAAVRVLAGPGTGRATSSSFTTC